jgi:hypothetical protein
MSDPDIPNPPADLDRDPLVSPHAPGSELDDPIACPTRRSARNSRT